MKRNRTEWVMHVWGQKRDTLELNDVEKFHIDMLRMFQSQQKKFDKILINIALYDVNDMNLFNFLKEKISEVLVNDNVEFKYCQNDPNKGEYVTFRPYVFDRIGEDVNVFYSHFKGYATYVSLIRESFPVRVVDLCESFWSYIMYSYSLNIKDVNEKLKDHSTYCWYVFKCEQSETASFCEKYNSILNSVDNNFEKYMKDKLHKHSPGSFAWYNLKRIGEQLKDVPYVTQIPTSVLEKQLDGTLQLCTHFSEVYIMQFLDEKECYSVKNYDKELSEDINPLYITIYPSKKFGEEHIKDFEKYLIDNNLF